eukprot:scaffold3050_cov362-Prasinococcus_capsulatus_cf.AAC.2
MLPYGHSLLASTRPPHLALLVVADWGVGRLPVHGTPQATSERQRQSERRESPSRPAGRSPHGCCCWASGPSGGPRRAGACHVGKIDGSDQRPSPPPDPAPAAPPLRWRSGHLHQVLTTHSAGLRTRPARSGRRSVLRACANKAHIFRCSLRAA